ncbi:hypothetical protein PAPYR_2837 [Paratrimastix pyriformis]|uniref:Uncharacterized protein n=1 Tax=Paratrimastix pyriformis TaxID=342808 RepID=A0ABQ8UP65_9EUKA|nr:hypothetical protein PAPYR_2837 [Paratrimastix pyriformis]
MALTERPYGILTTSYVLHSARLGCLHDLSAWLQLNDTFLYRTLQKDLSELTKANFIPPSDLLIRLGKWECLYSLYYELTARGITRNGALVEPQHRTLTFYCTFSQIYQDLSELRHHLETLLPSASPLADPNSLAVPPLPFLISQLSSDLAYSIRFRPFFDTLYAMINPISPPVFLTAGLQPEKKPSRPRPTLNTLTQILARTPKGTFPPAFCESVRQVADGTELLDVLQTALIRHSRLDAWVAAWNLFRATFRARITPAPAPSPRTPPPPPR